ncbi:MAG: glycoside hydrolase family 127 protein [Bacteroidales bacterium]|nr:glycoside hydrolase family 127 protein [Bacteroidales bacterium]
MNDLAKNSLIIALAMVFITTGCCREETSKPNDYPIRPVAFTDVRLTDDFWYPRIVTNHRVTIPIAFQKSEETGRIDNFRIAGELKEGKFSSQYPFDDSDVFKNIEAACYSMQIFPDPAMDAYLDTLISYITAAQEDDGYLYTNRTIDPLNPHDMAGPERWSRIEEGSHELYNVGHLYEAAVAHYQATGKSSLLEVALKNANLIDSLFGWGKLEIVPGHQEIEIGLVKLYRVTGDEKYLTLAKFFLDRRGPGGSEYNQMHLRPADQVEAVGHAVRAQYMYAAMADIAALTGDEAYLAAIGKLWNDVVSSKTYITGGIGAVRNHEGFSDPYYLPNEEAYSETCAAIANAFWNHRMFLLSGEARYFDVFEKVLYNGLLSGVSLSGDHFFYPNPLASSGQHSRKEWFGCACCPVNITRFLPSLPGYIYAVKDDELYVNLFMSNQAGIELKGSKIGIEQATGYPWDGKTLITINSAKPITFNLMIRIPGWTKNEAFPGDLYQFTDTSSQSPAFMVNGIQMHPEIVNGYASIKRSWRNDDKVIIEFPLEIRKVMAHPMVKTDSGLLALQYGPLIYCAEQVDQAYHAISNIMIDSDLQIDFHFYDDFLGGIGTLEGKAGITLIQPNGTVQIEPGPFCAIPYYAWANRGAGEMRVWFPENKELMVPYKLE